MHALLNKLQATVALAGKCANTVIGAVYMLYQYTRLDSKYKISLRLFLAPDVLVAQREGCLLRPCNGACVPGQPLVLEAALVPLAASHQLLTALHHFVLGGAEGGDGGRK